MNTRRAFLAGLAAAPLALLPGSVKATTRVSAEEIPPPAAPSIEWINEEFLADRLDDRSAALLLKPWLQRETARLLPDYTCLNEEQFSRHVDSLFERHARPEASHQTLDGGLRTRNQLGMHRFVTDRMCWDIHEVGQSQPEPAEFPEPKALPFGLCFPLTYHLQHISASERLPWAVIRSMRDLAEHLRATCPARTHDRTDFGVSLKREAWMVEFFLYTHALPKFDV